MKRRSYNSAICENQFSFSDDGLFELATSSPDRKRKRLDNNKSRIKVSDSICGPLIIVNDTTGSSDQDHKYSIQPTSQQEDEGMNQLDKYGIPLFTDNPIFIKKEVERDHKSTYSSFPNQRMERRLSIVGHMMCHDTIPARERIVSEDVQKKLLTCIPEHDCEESINQASAPNRNCLKIDCLTKSLEQVNVCLK